MDSMTSNMGLAEFLRTKADSAGAEDAALFGLCARVIEAPVEPGAPTDEQIDTFIRELRRSAANVAIWRDVTRRFIRSLRTTPPCDARDAVHMLRRLQDYIQHPHSCELQRWFKGTAEPKRCTCGLQSILNDASALVKRIEGAPSTKGDGQS